MASRLAQLALIITVLATALSLSTGTAVAGSVLSELVEIESASDDMNSTAVELSGATYNADNHVLLTVDDEHNAYEFVLNSDGTINHGVTPRVIELDLGRSDFEGIAWISGEKYAFLSEGDGEVIVATVPPVANDGTTTIGMGTIERSFPVISGNWGNAGPEGLATDGEYFYVTREIPASISKFSFDGTFLGAVDLSYDIQDASGVATLPDGTLLVISHESELVAHYDIDWDDQLPTLLETRSADGFTQLEGIAAINDTDVYLFGEDNTRKGNPGQTYAHLQGDLVAASFTVSDVNCSGHVNVSDALMVAQFRTELAEPVPGCGSGDHNADGDVNVADAMLIAQCSVGLHNVGCPPAGAVD